MIPWQIIVEEPSNDGVVRYLLILVVALSLGSKWLGWPRIRRLSSMPEGVRDNQPFSRFEVYVVKPSLAFLQPQPGHTVLA